MRRHRTDQQRLVLVVVEPADRADHPRVAEAELDARCRPRLGVGPVALEPDAVGDRVQARHRRVVLRARLARGRVRHRDECVRELRGRPPQQPVSARARIGAVLGVDRRRSRQPGRRRPVDQRQRVVRVHHVGAAERAREPRHQRRIDAECVLGHAQRRDAVLRELLRHRAVGRRSERHDRQLVPPRLLTDREVERDPLLATDAERRQHVHDAQAIRTIRQCERSGRSVAEAAADDEVLATLGIALSGPQYQAVQAACARIARRIRSERLRVVGFVPCDDLVAVPPIIIQLGLALCDLTGATVAVVDANVRYPGLAAVARGQATDRDDLGVLDQLAPRLARPAVTAARRAGRGGRPAARAGVARWRGAVRTRARGSHRLRAARRARQRGGLYGRGRAGGACAQDARARADRGSPT